VIKRKLIIHCSDSNIEAHDVDVIRKWHTDPPPLGRGWSDIGYHIVIERKEGKIQIGRAWKLEGAHTFGHNKEIGLCLCGKSGDFKSCQMQTLEQFVIDHREEISGVYQHSDFDPINKPFCAGLTKSQMDYLNSLL